MSQHLPLRLVVLISGRGSNLQALLNAIHQGFLHAEIVAVISNQPTAQGLSLAEIHGIPTHRLDHRTFDSRKTFDIELARNIQSYKPDLVILAGFMRLLTAEFVSHFSPRLINIHPSLLPAFPGLHTHKRAIQEGVKFHGCTVHVVTPELDHGPILGQAVVPIFSDDTTEALAARVLAEEHKLLAKTIQAIADGQWVLEHQCWVSKKSSRIEPKLFLSASIID